MNLGTTVVEHILATQAKTPMATGSFTRLLNGIIIASKIISREVNKAGLLDILGAAGRTNVQGEHVQKLDDFANHSFINRLANTGEVCVLASEEDADLIEIPRQVKKGNYAVVFDPLDGSSNIDANVSIGTIFGIFRRKTSGNDDGALEDILQPGSKQVAAGYIIYGSSTVMVLTTGNGVQGFTLDPTVGEYILSHENIRIPERGKTYSINEAYHNFWDEGTRNYLAYLKDPNADHGRSYTSRYIGSLVADFHRNLLYGGIFMYPADTKDPRKPYGKLRLGCECNPLALIVEQAGGLATTGKERIMDIEPTELHQRVPLIIGSKKDVETYQEFFQGKRCL